MKIKAINGYTKANIIEKIEKEFEGKAVKVSHNISTFTNHCQYLTDDGKKCIIGLFLPEGHKGQQSQDNVLGLLKEFPELERLMPFEYIGDLADLQTVHDILKSSNDLDDQRSILIDWINAKVE